MILINIIESYITKNKKYTNPTPFTPVGLMLHSVGCAQSKATVFINGFNSPSALSVHGFIDANTGDLYQALPWTYSASHCGSGSKGSGNSTHIGVEMCEPDEIVYTGGANFTIADSKLPAARKKAATAYNAAVELFAYLCNKFKLDPLKDGVVISHAEGYARGIASNHVDPTHLWKGLGLSYTMDGFRKDVASAMGIKASVPVESAKSDSSASKEAETSNSVTYRVRKSWNDAASQVGAYKTLENAKKAADKNPGYKVYNQNGSVVYTSEAEVEPEKKTELTNKPFTVQVSITNLNIRTGPSTDYPTNGRCTGRGVFTIVDTCKGNGSTAGWGLLKAYETDKNGWISLDYAKTL